MFPFFFGTSQVQYAVNVSSFMMLIVDVFTS